MSFGIDINGGIALRNYFLKVSEAQNIAQLLIVDPVHEGDFGKMINFWSMIILSWSTS